MKKKDIIIIAAVLLAALALFGVSQMAGGKAASTVVVTVDGEEVLRRRWLMSVPMKSGRTTEPVNVIAGGKRRGIHERGQLPRRIVHPAGPNEKRRKDHRLSAA